MYRRNYRNQGGATYKKYAPFIDAEFWEGMRGGFFRRPKYNVPLNIAETDTNYEVHVYAVGFDKKNITITVEDDVLLIRGKRDIDQDNPPKFKRQEFPVKHFERVVSLYGQVDTAQITARQEGEVLIITLPKLPDAQSSAQDVKID
ncbi:MAG: Hsp20/alpha crystallin family protein [Cyclobacteriaceae bacterium]